MDEKKVYKMHGLKPKWDEEFIKNNCLFLEVIYQDTDSCKCRIKGNLPDLNDDDMRVFLTELGEAFMEMLNGSFDEFARVKLGVNKHYLNIKLDAVYKKYFQWNLFLQIAGWN